MEETVVGNMHAVFIKVESTNNVQEQERSSSPILVKKNKDRITLEIIKEEVEGKKLHSCLECPFSSHDPDQFRDHLSEHLKNEKIIYPCNFCNYTTSNKYLLKSHSYVHWKVKPHRCQLCTYSTKDKHALQVHIMSKHMQEKPHKCDFCDFASTEKRYLKDHIKKHTGEEQYICNTCGYSNPHKSTFIVHVRMHTGVKPFKCHLCTYGANQKINLERHIHQQHIGKRPFKCNVCGYTTADKFRLKQHAKTHIGDVQQKPMIQCDYCDYKSAYKNLLSRHIRRQHPNRSKDH